MNKMLKYNQAKYALFDLAAREHLEVGDRFPSFREMVKIFPFSPVCLRRALEELETQGFLKRRRGSGIYLTHSIGTWEKRGTMLFLQIAPDAEMIPLEVSILRRYLHDRYIAVRPMAVYKPSNEVLEASEDCIGIFASGFVTKEWVAFLASLGKPVLYIGRNAATEKQPCVGHDWEGAVRLAVQELVKRGCRRIGFLDSDPTWYPSHVMAREYLAQMKANGLEAGEDDILYVPWLDDLGIEEFLRQRPSYDALIVEHDALTGLLLCSRKTPEIAHAVLAVLGAAKNNLSTDDVFFIGFQGNVYDKAGLSFFQSLNNPKAFHNGPELLEPCLLP